MEKHRIKIADFSIEQIALSGQCFRINAVDPKQSEVLVGERVPSGLWSVRAMGRELFIAQHDDGTHTFFCARSEFERVWTNYFDIHCNYSEIKTRIFARCDQYLTDAVTYGWGLRILRQDMWEVLVSFIISQRNNIPRIKGLVEKLCEHTKNQVFPSAKDLAKWPESYFEKLGLGYRAAYVKDAANSVMTSAKDGMCLIDARFAADQSVEDIISRLKQIKGVGDKVANCVALFGLHKIDAFPRDVWINRIIQERYAGRFHLGGLQDIGGIVQQYMFFYERMRKKVRSF
jgi:N-glycosylase/DNA lyase